MKVTVVGGGVAGLSTAVELSRRSVEVTLVESRKYLGGRARSFKDNLTGTVVDNGQHLLMRCCSATLEFLELLGTARDVDFQSRLDLAFADPNGIASLRVPRFLTGKTGLLAALMRYRAVPWHSAPAVARVMRSLDRPNDESVDDWMVAARQPPPLVNRFWHPLCLSVMNQRPRDASARLFAAVLREAFDSSGRGADLGWPTVGLSALHEPTEAYITVRNGSLRLGATVRRLHIGPPCSVELRSGEQLLSDAVVLALPPPSLQRLLSTKEFPDLHRRLARFTPSPIVSVNLWTETPLLDKPFLGFVGAAFDWVFRRDLLHEDRGTSGGYHLSLIASAANDLVGVENREILSTALDALRGAGITIDRRALLHHTVVREPRATYAHPLGDPPVSQRTPIDSLVLAGDWTDTGFPCTIEGAIRSGVKAADILRP
ncbi:MAG: hypothetical protein CME26_14690 [Gemmatimonadetes bacterium]|nr:hypothetical protein [Gemmatimonadota bacterium]